MAVGNVGKAAATGNVEPRSDGAAGQAGTETDGATCSHDTSRIAWAKLLAKIAEEFPVVCPVCGGDIRLIAFITDPDPVRRILSHIGEPVEPPPVSPARGPPTEWNELVQVHDDREGVQDSPDEFSGINIHSLHSL